ncbi:MAG: tetratricopeptide repeat protein [Candidatus Eisenbacteria bacterium]|nr:tetratricopeptide repeat protein [Candidatus Eisenbacteria bacterium]
MRFPARRIAALALLGLLASSCAYYNTFYLARKYYFKATEGLPYPVEKTSASSAVNYNKSIDYSKKVLGNYPKSKWVDDAYLLWACELLGKDDPLQTINMLQDYPLRFAQSPKKGEALFFLGVAYRQARKYRDAEQTLAQFLELAPKSDLAPYAYLERARALTAAGRDSEAAVAAGQVLERFPKSGLVSRARSARAEALYAAGEYAEARADFSALGLEARTDEERLGFLLREADCLEAARTYDPELALLKDALSHETPPAAGSTSGAGAPGGGFQIPAGADRYGRLMLRIGTAQLLAGRQSEALAVYQSVLKDYPKTPLGAEAQYRIAYAYEIATEDFERARTEYALVKDQFPSSAFTTQATQRLANIDRVMQFRTAGGDTLAKRAEAGFLLAELYLFQHQKPERALEEYRKVAGQYAGTPWAGKALNAEAWVLSRKLDRRAEADSLFWVVVKQYPATEAQLAARDYLEMDGIAVPAELIKLPERKLAPPDTTTLTPPPGEPMPLGPKPDSLRAGGRLAGGAPPRGGFMRPATPPRPRWNPRYASDATGAPGLAGDSPFTPGAGDSASATAPVPPGAAPDTSGMSGAGAPRDPRLTSGPGMPSDSSLTKRPGVPPDSSRAPQRPGVRDSVFTPPRPKVEK